MDLICERTQELTHADGGDDPDARRRRVRAPRRDGVHQPTSSAQRLGLRGHVLGLRLSQQASRRSATTPGRSPTPRARSGGSRSIIAVPLRHGDATVGLMLVLSADAQHLHRAGPEDARAPLGRPVGGDQPCGRARRAARPGRGAGALPHGVRRRLDRDHEDRSGRAHAGGEPRPGADARLHAPPSSPTMRFAEITHPDDIEYNLGLFHDLMAGVRDSYQLEKRYWRKDGKLIWSRITAVLERDEDGRPMSAISMIEDVTERKEAEEELRRQSELNEHQALHDALTGLPNRTLLRDRIQQAILTAQARGRTGSRPDDGSRPLQGDQRLARPPRRRRAAGGARRPAAAASCGPRTRSRGSAATSSACCCRSTTRPADVTAALEKIRQALEQPIVIQELPLAIEASIGVALYPDDGEDVDTLLQHADVAMYTAKEGNLPYAFYDASAPQLRSDPPDDRRASCAARSTSTSSSSTTSRRRRSRAARSPPSRRCCAGTIPSAASIMPDDFIPLAQQTGLMKPLTLYVVNEALRQSRAWQKEGLALSIAVNLSMRNLLDLEFPRAGARTCSRSGRSSRRSSSSRSPSRRCSPTRSGRS